MVGTYMIKRKGFYNALKRVQLRLVWPVIARFWEQGLMTTTAIEDLTEMYGWQKSYEE